MVAMDPQPVIRSGAHRGSQLDHQLAYQASVAQMEWLPRHPSVSQSQVMRPRHHCNVPLLVTLHLTPLSVSLRICLQRLSSSSSGHRWQQRAQGILAYALDVAGASHGESGIPGRSALNMGQD